jgi:Glycosyltransferase family 87
MRRWRTWPASASLTVSPARMLVAEVALLLVGLWLAGHVIDLTVYGPHVTNGDIKEYREYALAFWTVPPLFHHLPVEYPPLAVFPFSLTLLPPIPDAVDVFAVWMSLVVVLSYLWIRRRFSREQAIAFAVLLLVGANSTVLARFDLFPALATLGALWALRTHRFTWAYMLLAIGILLKLYPAFLVPIAAIEHWRLVRGAEKATGRARSRIASVADRVRTMWQAARAEVTTRAMLETARGVALCAVIVAATFGVAELLSPSGALSGFVYQSDRPLQIESVPASLVWVGTFFGLAAHGVYSFNSLNYVGALDAVLEPLSTVALVAGCLYVYWRQLRGRLTVGRAMIACLCVLLVTNKVFSPQYLIWVLPLVAIEDGVTWLWVVVGILTTLIFPYLYFEHRKIEQVPLDWRFLPLVAIRNALLVLITVRAMRDTRATLVPAAAPPSLTVDRSQPRVRRRITDISRREVPTGTP